MAAMAAFIPLDDVMTMPANKEDLLLEISGTFWKKCDRTEQRSFSTVLKGD